MCGSSPLEAKRLIGNLADGVDLYDRLTGEQLITFSGLLFGLERDVSPSGPPTCCACSTSRARPARIVADYSAGMTKKIALAAALVHSPRVLVLDEPFESVDPVSAANIRDILAASSSGGTVIVSSHSMDLVERMCDHVAIIAAGKVLVAGTVDEVRGAGDLETVSSTWSAAAARREPGVVAVLLRLRFRVLANTLRRNTFQLVAVIFGGLQALMLLRARGRAAARIDRAARGDQAVVVVGGRAGARLADRAAALRGRRADPRPAKLARFPLRTGQLMLAMFLVGVTWVPGITTIARSVATAIAWRSHPLSAVLAVVTGSSGRRPASRLAADHVGHRHAAARARCGTGGRSPRWSPLVARGAPRRRHVGGVARAADLLAGFTAAIEVLGWTPFGAVWSIPAAWRSATWPAPPARRGSPSARSLVLVLWRAALGASTACARAAAGAHASSAAASARSGWCRPPPTGAVAARSLIYWFRDARHTRQLIMIPMLPALMLLWWRLFDVDAIAFATGPVVASLLPLSVFAALSRRHRLRRRARRGRARPARPARRAAALLILAVPAGHRVQVGSP